MKARLQTVLSMGTRSTFPQLQPLTVAQPVLLPIHLWALYYIVQQKEGLVPVDMSDCLLATGMICAFIGFIPPPGAREWSGQFFRHLLCRKMITLYLVSLSPRLLLQPKTPFSLPYSPLSPVQGSDRAPFTSTSALITCGMVTLPICLPTTRWSP